MYPQIRHCADQQLPRHRCTGVQASIFWLAGVAPELVVRKHLVHITSPPDVRYAPLQATAGQERLVYREVRALVVPVIPDRSGTKFPVLPQVIHPIHPPNLKQR